MPLKLFKSKNEHGFLLNSTGTNITGAGVLIDPESNVGREAMQYVGSALTVSEDDLQEHPLIRQKLPVNGQLFNAALDLLQVFPEVVLRPALKNAPVKAPEVAAQVPAAAPVPAQVEAPAAEPVAEVPAPEVEGAKEAPASSKKIKFGAK